MEIGVCVLLDQGAKEPLFMSWLLRLCFPPEQAVGFFQGNVFIFFPGNVFRTGSQPGQKEVALLVMAAVPEEAGLRKSQSLLSSSQYLWLFTALSFALLPFLRAILNSHSNLVDRAFYFAKE